MSSSREHQFDEDLNLQISLRKIFPNNKTLQNIIFAKTKNESVEYLIQKTIHGNALTSVSTEMKIYFLRLMKLLQKGSRDDQLELMEYNEALLKFLHVDDTNNVNARFIPIALEEARKQCENKKGFINHLPTPRVSKRSEYACVDDIEEALNLKISTGLKFERIVPFNKIDLNQIHPRSIMQSSSVRQLNAGLPLLENTDNIINLSMWFDKYDSGGSTKGKKRGNLKLFTISVINKPDMTKRHTIPLALIPGKDDQEDFTIHLYQELRTLKFVDSESLDFVNFQGIHARFILAYFIGDRIEYDELLGFLGARSFFSGIAGHCCPTYSNETVRLESNKTFHACQDCIQRRANFYRQNSFSEANLNPGPGTCQKCFDWDFTKVKFNFCKPFPKAEMDEYIRQEHYTNRDGHLAGHLSSREITFDSIERACRTIYDRIATRKWTEEEAKNYGRYECLNLENVTKEILNSAILFRERNNERAQNQQPLIPPEFPEDLLPIPVRFKDVLPMQYYHVGLMHTVALNGGKNMFHLLDKALSTVSPALRDTCRIGTNEDILNEVQKISLSWLKCWKQPRTYWVSENYLAFAYVAKSFGSHIASTCEEEARGRGVETSLQLTACFFSWNAMVSMCFMDGAPTECDANRLGSLVKIFLSYYNLIDSVTSRTSEHDEESKIDRCSSLQTLLTLSDKMKKFGNLRNFWEGGYDGEGFVRVMKPLLKRGIHRPGNLKAVLDNYNCRSVLEEMLCEEIEAHQQHEDAFSMNDNVINQDDETSNGRPEEAILTTNRYRRFHCYSTIDLAYESLNQKKPIALMFYKTTKSWFILHFDIDRKRALKEIKAADTSYREINYTLCFQIDPMLQSEALLIENVSLESSDYVSVVCLPMFIHNPNEGGREVLYYMITEDHEEFGIENHVFKFVRPNCI